MTDLLGFEGIEKPTRDKYEKEFEADPSFIWEVKRDWYGLDLDFVRKHPQSLFWVTFVDAQYEHDFLRFMKLHAIQRRIDEIVEFYQRTDEEIECWYGRRTDKYLSKLEYDLFVRSGSPLLLSCYEILFEKHSPIEDKLSVLELALETFK
ncbi:MAG: hypothetical protein GTO14_23855 [Anaerolineales bacterium]|nr:hypothetical protein [Anaerolineales bacterium]